MYIFYTSNSRIFVVVHDDSPLEELNNFRDSVGMETGPCKVNELP